MDTINSAMGWTLDYWTPPPRQPTNQPTNQTDRPTNKQQQRNNNKRIPKNTKKSQPSERRHKVYETEVVSEENRSKRVTQTGMKM